ncbi:formate/nitrite transporter family protein [Roseomonas elaeocarpi]|uniref:Formate/nitrite transporter family protein n=1 Tax=Roseomonas elaeocarpi TaxID=907779 RepID=A0ABV6JWS4_9PROT
MPEDQQQHRKDAENEDVQELSAPRSPVIYEVVRRQGQEELERPVGSLFWSGFAAGIAIMASVIAQGALMHKLPPGTPGREVIAELGYSLGFLLVILGRMQLFTEQTIVTVLPNMAEPGWHRFATTARLWGIVFLANMLGTAAAAFINIRFHLVSPELAHSMLEVSAKLLPMTPSEVLLQGIPAGFLIASVAWIRAAASGGEFAIVLVLTYAIALGGFTHVVAGAAEAFLLLFDAQAGLGQVLGGMILPALVGNVIGGTGLFALLVHAQVRQEM